MIDSKALVIFSGGQDSTTCLGWAKNRYREVVAISFYYGQKHQIELEQAKKIASALSVPLELVDIHFYQQMVYSALTGDPMAMNAPHRDNAALPASFVPNRNALFILLAHSYAQQVKAHTMVAGLCQTDYSGYPDCREPFAKSLILALNQGSDQQIELLTPLMYLTKAETFALAEQEGVLPLVLAESHTCYQGSSTPNPWGRGCGLCPACLLRAKGYQEYLSTLERSTHG
ncbi:MAG: 7-cyano-7-deazaguanine synthase QueC [Candidatus Lambdaproteobacteria bacterium RIFOXYD1_FULL_56_27]|uniref:7-cyano-7-deazaguanine synthase n=1 Tax=Candidatus Lambdaproteobacteria bacterium RIFOXYD2_FULL_56_26 TaxID=1817773 RepID=A0A1F6GQ28_9PROT|nr:MAG: 7-cyano-7-deazaguanine synthase QueC [Candidatus Lambdaproteobacteria bacterium RIFOXYD2_FULL_56_26]OGH03710.1 MAG: 7-cyano-7-deazaguanine synthase QueC [Candidatus Lambdaproteobacteria bacterium RIFOXYC1_FULL_56_13]OGH07294.1 MAG: 7-cyano-7-deazaguanine synthase QueC [Candidatus Lambdaproteobacteria bacterium RIFOXYD1_FULL_56_27]